MLYRTVLFIKLVAVLVYAGGLAAACTDAPLEDRRRAVHRVASPALLVVWLTGFGLAELLHVPFTELWIATSLGLSFVSMGALTTSVSAKTRSQPARVVSIVALLFVLALMVFRPTWAEVCG